MKNTKIFFAFLLFTSLIITSCNQKGTVRNISTEETTTMLEAGKFPQILDVRSPAEYTEKHIKGAKNINFDDASFKTQIESLDKKAPTLVYCLSGGRSTEAAKVLTENGFKEVYQMDGGLLTWENKGGAVESADKPMGTAGISMADFNKMIEKSDKIIVVDFFATWCGPCKKLSPILEEIEKEHKAEVEVIKIDVDQNPELAKAFKIDGIPVLKAYNKSKLIWEVMGLDTKENIMKNIGL